MDGYVESVGPWVVCWGVIMDDGIKVEKDDRSKAPAGAGGFAVGAAAVVVEFIIGADVSMAPDSCEVVLVWKNPVPGCIVLGCRCCCG